MNVERPDISGLDPAVQAYIEALEAEIESLSQGKRKPRPDAAANAAAETLLEPCEPPTTVNVITVSAAGVAKRTPRHLYARQRRGGMGVFDLQVSENDPPAFLILADESQSLIALTDQAQAFRLPVHKLPESQVHGRGRPLAEQLRLPPGQRLALVFPDQAGTYVALLTERGHVHWMAGHLLAKKLIPGTVLYDVKKLGPPAAACWTPGGDDLFIATRRGKAIRFAARQVPARGCLGIRLERDDTAIAIAALREESGVFLLGADGKGTIRLMSGFRANKAPGSGGKTVIKAERLVGAQVVGEMDDLFAISRLGKIIRFQAIEVPPKEGVVQGVNCMALRADEVVAVAASSAPA